MAITLKRVVVAPFSSSSATQSQGFLYCQSIGPSRTCNDVQERQTGLCPILYLFTVQTDPKGLSAVRCLGYLTGRTLLRLAGCCIPLTCPLMQYDRITFVYHVTRISRTKWYVYRCFWVSTNTVKSMIDVDSFDFVTSPIRLITVLQ